MQQRHLFSVFVGNRIFLSYDDNSVTKISNLQFVCYNNGNSMLVTFSVSTYMSSLKLRNEKVYFSGCTGCTVYCSLMTVVFVLTDKNIVLKFTDSRLFLGYDNSVKNINRLQFV